MAKHMTAAKADEPLEMVKEIAFIDSSVSDYRLLIQQLPDRVAAIVLDGDCGYGGVGPSWMNDYQGFSIKIWPYPRLKTMFSRSKIAD